MIHYIYIHKNPNTKEPFYVGLSKTTKEYVYTRAYATGRSNQQSWKEEVKKLKGLYEVEIIHLFDNKEDCCQKEMELIAKYGRRFNGTGCLINISPGGHKWKADVPVYQYDLDGKYLKEWQSVKEAAENLNVKASNIYFACKSNRIILSKYQFKRTKVNKIKPYRSKTLRTIYIFNELGEYLSTESSIVSAAKKYNLEPNTISQILNKNIYSSKGYTASYSRNKVRMRRLIYQHTKEGILVNKFISLSDVKKALKLNSHNSIDNALKGIQKTAYGFIWSDIKNTIIYAD